MAWRSAVCGAPLLPIEPQWLPRAKNSPKISFLAVIPRFFLDKYQKKQTWFPFPVVACASYSKFVKLLKGISQFYEFFWISFFGGFSAIYPNCTPLPPPPALGCLYCIGVCARPLALLDAFLDSILKEEFQRKAAKFSLQLHIMYSRVAEHYILEQGHAQAEFSFFSPREIGVKNCAHYLY